MLLNLRLCFEPWFWDGLEAPSWTHFLLVVPTYLNKCFKLHGCAYSVHACVTCMWRSEVSWGNWDSPFNTCVPGFTLRKLSLTVGAFAHKALLLAWLGVFKQILSCRPSLQRSYEEPNYRQHTWRERVASGEVRTSAESHQSPEFPPVPPSIPPEALACLRTAHGNLIQSQRLQ